MSSNFSTISSCSYLNTTIPEPTFITNSSVTSCVISNLVPAPIVILSRCCNTTGGHIVVPDKTQGFSLNSLSHGVETGSYDANGCTWQYCNVTGQSGADVFNKCLKRTTLKTANATIQGKCFIGKEGAQLEVTSDGNKIKWRSDKKKDTISAALLIALGVAGIIIGGT